MSAAARRPFAVLRRLAACALIAGVAHASAPLDAEIAAVREAAARGNLRALEAARSRFAGHVLEAYPHYWLLAAQLERGADRRDIEAFLARHDGTPLAEALRRDWLKALGASAAWDAFRAELPRLAADDPEVACYAFQERLARGDPEAGAEARTLFLAAREAPAACDPVFAALLRQGALSEGDAEHRIRRLLAANAVREAKRTLGLLAPRPRIHEKLLDQVAADPARFLVRHARASLLTRSERELAVFAVSRIARAKPDEAAERLAQIAPRLGEEATAFAFGQVALHAAMAHHPRALEWFALAGDAASAEPQLAWKARAALRAGDWRAALAAIQQLPPEAARESAWRYWRARAFAALGEAEASAGLLRSLAGERHFYGLLAAEELGLASPPDWNGAKLEAAEVERVASLPGVRRALALYRAGLDPEAFREWQWAIRAMSDRELIAASEVALRAGRAERAINTSNRTVQLHDFAQRYPVSHRDAVAAAARQFGLDEALMFSIIRQESRFTPEARSRVGATGLMQLMPATARWVARQLPVKAYRADMLVQPDVNVLMGSYYFGRVLEALGHPVLATAAYNAGPGRARRWRDDLPLEGAIYIETIPFNETRDYVKQVFANAWFYRHRLTGQAPSLKALVGVVPGRNGEREATVASALP